jgi:hypothetical protein
MATGGRRSGAGELGKCWYFPERVNFRWIKQKFGNGRQKL